MNLRRHSIRILIKTQAPDINVFYFGTVIILPIENELKSSKLNRNHLSSGRNVLVL